MNIAAITKFKHGDIFSALKQLGWTQTELAKRSGLSMHKVANIINLKRRPSQESADAIQLALGEAGIFIDVLETWPETFTGLPCNSSVQIKDVEAHAIQGYAERLMLGVGDDQSDLIDQAVAAIDDLTPKEKDAVVSSIMGKETCAEVGSRWNICGGRVAQIRQHAIRKLRYKMGLKCGIDSAGYRQSEVAHDEQDLLDELTVAE